MWFNWIKERKVDKWKIMTLNQKKALSHTRSVCDEACKY